MTPSTAPRSASRPIRVLIAEDVEPLRRFLVRALNLMGFATRSVSSIEEVDATVRDFAPDVALIDWNLGDHTAVEAFSSFNAHAVRVIIMTGDPDGLGPMDLPVLSKPIDMERLKIEIESAAR